MAVLSSRWADPAATRRSLSLIREGLKRASVPAALKNLVSMPLTVAGAALFDWGVFTVNSTAGLMVAGLLLIGLEFIIADGD